MIVANDEWVTPQDLYDALDSEFDFDLDVACTPKNCKARYGMMTVAFDALTEEWRNVVPYTSFPMCWMNPPYSKPNLLRFSKKAHEESRKGCTVVGLLPGDGSTTWFKKYAMKAHEIRYCAHRVRFIDPKTGKQAGSPAFCSIIVVWKPGEVENPKISVWDWK